MLINTSWLIHDMYMLCDEPDEQLKTLLYLYLIFYLLYVFVQRIAKQTSPHLFIIVLYCIDIRKWAEFDAYMKQGMYVMFCNSRSLRSCKCA